LKGAIGSLFFLRFPMGLFSSKRKVVVNLTTQKLFEESQIPDSARQGLIKGIMKDQNLVTNMLEESINSIAVRANSAQTKAIKNDYGFGMPKSGIKSNIDAKSLVLGVIANNVGQSITPIYYTMAPMNSFHYAWSWLVNTHGYNPDTNELVGISASTGKKCYLSNMIATYTKESYDFMVETNDMGMLEQLGPPPTSGYTPSKPFTSLQSIGTYDKQPSYEVSSVAVEDYVTIQYEYEESPGIFITRGLTLSLSAVDLTTDFHQCRYRKDDGKTGFFTYRQGSGVYPLVDAVFTTGFNNLGNYYPWIYFVANNTRVSRWFDQKPYKDAYAFAEQLGISYEMLDEEVNRAPDIADVAQSMLMFGIAPNEKNEYCIQYLFNHFSLLHENARPAKDKSNDLEDKFNIFTTSPSQVQRIADKYFSMSLQFSGIQKRTKPGKIGIVNTYTSEYAVVGQNDQRFFINGAEGVSTGTSTSSQPAWIYRRQVTTSTYEEIAVYGLRADYNIHNKKGYGASATDDKLLIPIDRDILKSLSMRGKEQVLSRGLTFFVSTVVIITTPWYASSTFKIIMLIVAVVITIFSLGTAWQSIVAAAALGATALILTVIQMIVISLAINYGVKLFVKELGPEAGIFVAIAAMAIGAYASSNNASWGDALVAIGNNMATVSTEVMQSTLEDAIADFEQFSAYAKGMFDILEEAKEIAGLDGQYVGLEPLEMVYRVPDLRIGEAPNDFYNRTVHSGNIGVSSYEMIENFVSTKLTLPQLADTEMMEVDNGLAI